MEMVWTAALLSVFVVSLISFIGIFTFSLKVERLKTLVIYMVSFSTGALLGDVFFHLLPEIVEKEGFNLSISFGILAGILFSFIIEKFIHWNHCHLPITKHHVHPFSVLNLVGDGIHNFIDGIIIGVSYLVSIPVGLATTLAVVLHEIPQEIGDFGVLIHGGFTRAKALFFNFLTALTSVIGVILTLSIGTSIEGVVSVLVPFAAGNFLYIASSDLIPELHKEVNVKRSMLQFLFILFGIMIMMLLLLIEF